MPRAPRISSEQLDRLGAQVGDHAGLELPPWVLEARARERATALGIDGAGYVTLVSGAAGRRELDLLVETLRVGETRFFRHAAQLRAITDVVVPALRAAGASAVRAWSAGCATGEEAYTLAMLLRRGLPATVEVSVLGSDLSDEALAVARAGVYPEDALAHVPPELRRWAFSPHERPGAWRVSDAVAGLVGFERRNLAEGRFPRGLDVLLCRNVLIYFAPAARARVVSQLVASLADGGFLLVGYAETLRGRPDVEAVQAADAVLYRKAKAEPKAAPARRRSPQPAPRAVAAPGHGKGAVGAPLDSLVAEDAVLELRGRYDDGERLTRELAGAMAGRCRRLVVDLDDAEFLADGAAAVLRRARAAARAAGLALELAAGRPGLRRWLRRHGLQEDA